MPKQFGPLFTSALCPSFFLFSMRVSPQHNCPIAQALANDFIRFFDRHEIEKAILMGHSLGGKAAMTTALLYPDRVEKLIVADMSPHTYKVNADSMMQVKTILSSMHGVDLSMMKTRNDVDKYLAPFIPDITVRRFILQNLALSSTANFSKPPQSGGEKMGMQWRPNIAVLLEKYHMLTDSDCTDYVNGKLASASVYSKPVLFVKGGKSDYITEHSTADIMYLFPNSTIHIIPQAAHWVHIDSPEDYVKCTHAFITS